ncbi:MAG: hypothetical protein HQK53_13600 [Oligoflexia bacterium]|nr:hypothetical protein [Oligoflexia bacterium]
MRNRKIKEMSKIIWIVLFFIVSVRVFAAAENVCLPQEPQIISKTQDNMLLIYDIEDASIFENQNNLYFNVIKDALLAVGISEAQIYNNPSYPIDLAMKFYATKKDPVFQAEAKNLTTITTKNIGVIRKVNTLESFLYTQQIKHFPLTKETKSSEFMAYILKKRNIQKQQMKIVLFLSNGLRFKVDTAIVKQHVQDGWQLSAHIHNHPFYIRPQEGLDIGGVIAPSVSDVQMHRVLVASYGLENAIITNGLFSIEVAGKDFDKL